MASNIFRKGSIAVFGGAQAQEVIRQSDRMGYLGEIWPAHPKKMEILGRPVYRSVAQLPASPDAAYLGINCYLTIDVVRDLAARDAFQSGSFERPRCKKENDKREAEAEMLDGSIMGIDAPSAVTKPCRYCELACPVAQQKPSAEV